MTVELAEVGVGPAGLRPQDVGLGLLFWRIRDAAVVGEATSGRIVLWNPAAARLFGYAADEAVGLPLEVLVPDALKPRHRAGLAAYAAAGTGPLLDADAPVEVPAVHKSGAELAVELSLTPIERARVPGRYVLALIRDATPRARLAAERAALLAAAEATADRLRALAALKADFAALVAHELSGPVAALGALAELLADDALDPVDRARLLGALRAEAEHLRVLVADAGAAAAGERDDFAVCPFPVRLGRVLADAAAFARTLPGDHPFALGDETAAEDGAVRVVADPERVGQVLRNLLGNAAKHTPPGTPLALRARREGGRVRIEVVDRGPGIAPADAERVFAKFERGRDAAGQRAPGLGLGLYLARRLARAHGGELTLTPTSGGGATFSFTLEITP